MAGLARVAAFLGAVLVLAKLCDDEGLFEAAGAAMARRDIESQGLMRQVFVIAATITAALSLDATVVLMTPVVLATVRRLRAPLRPYAYSTAHLANAASLLLPVSNLTNLLAYHVADISFVKFTVVMTLPWVAAVAAVYVVFRWFSPGICGSSRIPSNSGHRRVHRCSSWSWLLSRLPGSRSPSGWAWPLPGRRWSAPRCWQREAYGTDAPR